MDVVTMIGIGASIGTGTSLVPQLVKILKTKKTADVSFVMLAVLFSGLALWVCYGILRNDWIIVVSNGFSLVMNGIILYMSFRYKK